MTSPVIVPNSEQCVEFYFFSFKNQLGRLNVYAKFVDDQSNGMINIPLWSLNGMNNEEDSAWQIAQVSIGHGTLKKPYKVIFEYVTLVCNVLLDNNF